MWCNHANVMEKLLPLFIKGYSGIEVVQATMSEQLELCLEWYTFYCYLFLLNKFSVTVYHEAKKSLDPKMQEKLHSQDETRIVSFLKNLFKS